MMRIMFTTTSGSLLDGINRHLLNVVPELNKKPDVECAVCIAHRGDEFVRALSERGVKVYCFNAPHGHHWRCFFGFYRAVKDFKPTLFHTGITCFADRFVAKFFFRHIPWVTTFHGVRMPIDVAPLTLKGRIKRYFMSILTSLPCAKVFYVSRTSLKIDAEYGLYTDRKRRLAYNPIDFDHPPAATGNLRKLIGVGDDVLLIGTACRVAAIKSPELFTEVMCRVVTRLDFVHAVIMGDGPCMTQVRQIVASHGCGDRVHLLGYRRDAAELDADLDCFIMTSEYEGMPTAILEAIAAKTPIAFMKAPGGLTDLFEMNESDGPMAVTVEYGDVEGLASGIVDLMRSREKRRAYAERAYENCRKVLGVEASVRRFYEGYQEVFRGE